MKHLLRRSLKQDPRKRAEIDEIEDVLVQRLDILDAQNKEFVKLKLPPEDEVRRSEERSDELGMRQLRP